jgi:hypothetical protein
MTSYYPFVPSNIKAPSFTPIFDGNQYTITVVWNVSAQRYFVKCTSFNNNLIFMVPLVESLLSFGIKSLVWDVNNSYVIVTLDKEHQFLIGEIVLINIVQAVPTTYNGNGMATIISNRKFTYPMTQNPGYMQQGGVVNFLTSMTKSYFNSTLVYRNRQFEVSP